MPVHVYVFLLVVCLLLCLVLLWRHDWLHHQPSHAQAGRRRPLVPRLLKSRSPDDCPACSHAYTAPSGAGPATVRPWSEVKSRRGAPKRIPTEGFACPNRQCAYFGNTDAHMHALVGDGKHGRAEQLQTFRCQACRTTFSARRDTPLYRLKTPSQQVAVVLSALAEGLDLSAAERVFGFRQATITSLSDSCWRARSDVARALLLSSPSPALAAGRAAYAAALLHTGASFCGWRLIPAPRFFPSSSLVPARSTWPIRLFTPCDRCWPQAVFRSLRVTGSISTFMRSQPTLASGSRCVVEDAMCANGWWNHA